MALLGKRTFRQASEDDLDRLVEIHAASYADSRDAEARRRNFLHNPLGAFASDLWLCLDGEAIVGHAFLFSLRAHFSGKLLPIGAIASVGVAPEARKTGVASALLSHLHAVARDRGDVLTVLYAFRQGFYARAGYAPVTPSQRLIFSPAAVPSAWRGPVRAVSSRDDVEQLWSASMSTGMLERPRALWDRKWLDERRNVLVTDGGYVAYALEQSEAHAETRLVVQELVATNDAARRRLVGALGAQDDHASEIELEVPQGDPLSLALMDADRRRFGTLDVEHCTGMIVGGPMIRLASVSRALEARGVDPSAVRTDAPTLGVLLFGGWKISDAVRLGVAESDAPDSLLAHAPYFSPDPF
jgi:predicted acetyltransferase